MKEPNEVVTIHWVEWPPAHARKRTDTHHEDCEAQVHYVWWRGRWCKIHKAALELFESFDARLWEGSLGLLFEKVDR